MAEGLSQWLGNHWKCNVHSQHVLGKGQMHYYKLKVNAQCSITQQAKEQLGQKIYTGSTSKGRGSKRRVVTEKPTVSSLVAALKDCARLMDLVRGKEVHIRAIDSGLFTSPYVFSSLINMYAHCGSMIDAREVFDSHLHSDLVSWNALLQGYAENGESELALKLFDGMENAQCGCAPDARTFVAALSACATLASSSDTKIAKDRWLRKGKAIHSQAVNCQCCNIFVENKLIDMYARCGNMEEARSVFDKMVERTAVSWTALLQGYFENDKSEIALELFERMAVSCAPITRTYVAALTGCAALGEKADRISWLEKGRAIHSQAASNRCCDIYVETTLIGMYARCGSMVEARNVFDRMVKRNVVSWNALLQGYVDNQQSQVALELYDGMKEANCVPDTRTYVTALAACAALAAAENRDDDQSCGRWFAKGKEIHARAIDRKCCDIFLESVLVDMYAKCGSMVESRRVFDGMMKRNVVAWNSLLQGYVDNGEAEVTLELFDSMETVSGGCFPDARTYVAALVACASLGMKDADDDEGKGGWLDKARFLHLQAMKNGCFNVFVRNTLIHTYASLGVMDEARQVFEEMSSGDRDVVSWNCLLQGYVNNGENKTALDLIAGMDMTLLDCATFIAAIMACGKLLEVGNGRAFHAQILRCGFEENVSVSTCLVDFYGKCGRIEAAGCVFESIVVKDTYVWDTYMYGFSQQGDTERVLELFEEMKDVGISPSEITFTHILSACSHAGLAYKGRKFFDAMLPEYGVRPNFKHYNCLVDILGRANYLEEAFEMAMKMPFEQDVKTWTTILSACVKWKNVVVGKAAYKCLVKLNERDAAAYVLMANIYGSPDFLNLVSD